MVKSIFLQDGEEIFVDDEDYEKVSQHTWWKMYRANTRSVYAVDENENKISLNNYIINGSFQIIKNNYFTKENLTTEGNSSRWARPRFNQKSRYKGVSWNSRTNMWFAKITIRGKLKHLGAFKNEDEAARIYNNAVELYWQGQGFINSIGQDNRLKVSDYKILDDRNNTRPGKSGYKGVFKAEEEGFWKAIIFYEGKNHHILYINGINKAALAYNKCSIYLHGDNNGLNNVPMTDELKEFIANWEIPDKIKKLKEKE